MRKVFDRIGKTEQALNAERFISIVSRHDGISYEDAYKTVHSSFPDMRDFEGIFNGAIRSGQIALVQTATGLLLKAAKHG